MNEQVNEVAPVSVDAEAKLVAATKEAAKQADEVKAEEGRTEH